MVTSSADELPANIEFLFSVNRPNVAISRAQALAVVQLFQCRGIDRTIGCFDDLWFDHSANLTYFFLSARNASGRSLQPAVV
jgi:hypothetical protein